MPIFRSGDPCFPHCDSGVREYWSCKACTCWRSSESPVVRVLAKIQHMGVTGVPAFIVGNRYAVMGAREPEVIAQAIQEVARERTLPAGNA